MKYVSYLRVSTKQQGSDGMGIEAQRTAVERYIGGNELVAEFVEVESARKGSDRDRPILAEALRLCKINGHTLIVAKIDRLYRNLFFTSKLLESNVQFICCDMPFANKMNIQLFALLAEWEAEKISERTKVAMAEVKKHGSKSGLPIGALTGSKKFGHVGVAARIDIARRDPVNRMAYAYIKELKERSISFDKIVKKLNESGYLTSKGKPFKRENVMYIYRIFHSPEIDKYVEKGKQLKVEMLEELKSPKMLDARMKKIRYLS